MAAVAKKIMVTYDGSDPARRAPDRAAELAGYGATVTVVRVGSSERDQALLAGARKHLAERHIRAQVVERFGEAAETLVESATTENVDLLILGKNRDGVAQPGSARSAPRLSATSPATCSSSGSRRETRATSEAITTALAALGLLRLRAGLAENPQPGSA